jgi:hypothetical protein
MLYFVDAVLGSILCHPRCWVAMVTIVFGSSVLSLVSHLVLAFAGRNYFWDLVPLFRM